MNWSPQQSDALIRVSHWIESPNGQQVFRMFGYAGTGKSSLARHLAGDLDGPVIYGAYTGKAALVMRKNGCADATTIHSFLYSHQTDDRGHVTWTVNKDGPAARAKLIVIDEVSMVNRQMGEDLLSLGVPILVLGDPAQLPPVDRGKDAGGFFTAGRPDIMLTEIHRQAGDNPIIQLATRAREGKRLMSGNYGASSVIRRDDVDPVRLQQDVLTADQVLVGRNVTRQGYNRRIRQLLGCNDPFPVAGDKLVCLKNNRNKGLLNGGIWRAHESNPGEKEIGMLVDSEEFTDTARKDVLVPKEFFTGGAEELHWKYLREMDQMTFGYALTVHKSQGSQWPRVVLFDESAAFRDDAAKWLYTAVTRAAESITVVAA